ncbi:single-strand DNA-binding protein [Ruminococcus sp. YE71]|uniref:single-stranded DNA-binding protein n=1 Tax=unclassified Ruminococcus TaxID=2608920 RepID=UPI00088B210A|nr:MULTISPECIES: single-stranded DNA-binding protein [unclassified Ruminococcus]SDA24193.1 single-strand DNA-binding protein [Ruminococcus sp. YE78]SFW41554.1 single-strand DNA-binding protein [Ruminococcus sp. YE71]
MLNKVILSGRITQDLELRQTNGGNAVLQFTLAVQRNFAKQGEERQTDFITCVAWGKTAEFISRFFRKGKSIAIVGNLRSRTYDDKNGTKHYVTEVFVDEAQFTFEPKDQGGYAQQSYNNGGYQQGGSYNGGGYQQGGSYNQAPRQPAQNSYQNQQPQQPDDAVSIGDFQDFNVDVYNDDGLPF